MKHINYSRSMHGFTLVEVLVVIGIMTVLMSVFIFNYQDYTQTIVVNRLSNEVILTLREAQFYATGVKEVAPGTDNFSGWYAVHFQSNAYSLRALETQDFSSEYVTLATYQINDLDQFFYDSAGDTNPEEITDSIITFRRPILAPVITDTNGGVNGYRLEIVLHSPDLSVERRVCVEETGRMFIAKGSCVE